MTTGNPASLTTLNGTQGRLRLPLIPLASAVVNWIAIANDWTVLQNISKPATTIILAIWFLWQTRNPQHRWSSPLPLFAAGLTASLAGDVLLISSREGFFDAGLAAFLIAHVLYTTGFNIPWVRPNALTALFALALLAYLLLLFIHLSPHLPGLMKLSVAAYAIALGSMTLSAADTCRRPDWRTAPALLAAAGGITFLASDSMLAINRFIPSQTDNELAVMITYYLGQFGIVSGVVNWHCRLGRSPT